VARLSGSTASYCSAIPFAVSASSALTPDDSMSWKSTSKSSNGSDIECGASRSDLSEGGSTDAIDGNGQPAPTAAVASASVRTFTGVTGSGVASSSSPSPIGSDSIRARRVLARARDITTRRALESTSAPMAIAPPVRIGNTRDLIAKTRLL
jgi:hypothetical protein